MTKIQYHPLPAPGDIVWCHFPYSEALGNPGPKARPALVLAVSPEDHAIRVAYGTTQRTNNIHAGEFVLDPAEAGFSVSGLAERTKFDLGRSVQVPFDSDWFQPNPGIYATKPLPKMGILHPSYMQAARKALSQIP